MKQKTNRIMTFGITELLPLLSESSRNEVLRLAEEKHLELAATLPKPEDALPEWHSELCAAVRSICDHVSITVLKHVHEHMAAMGDDDANLSNVTFWVHQYFLCKLDARLASDAYSDSYHHDFIQTINPNQDDDHISELMEKQLRAFYIAGYIDGAADMDALPK